MSKIFKKIAAIAMAGVMATGLCIGASANSVTAPNGSANFEWSSTYAKLTNLTNQSRKMIVVFKVFEDNTGRRVGSDTPASGSGSYGASVQVNNTQYSSNGYNFQMYGEIYTDTTYNSPVFWSSGTKYVD